MVVFVLSLQHLPTGDLGIQRGAADVHLLLRFKFFCFDIQFFFRKMAPPTWSVLRQILDPPLLFGLFKFFSILWRTTQTIRFSANSFRQAKPQCDLTILFLPWRFACRLYFFAEVNEINQEIRHLLISTNARTTRTLQSSSGRAALPEILLKILFLLHKKQCGFNLLKMWYKFLKQVLMN